MRQRPHILKSLIEESDDPIPNKKIRFEILRKLSGKHALKTLSFLSGISLSGYYQFLKQTENTKELADVDHIRKISIESKQKYGYRTMTMKLKQQ